MKAVPLCRRRACLRTIPAAAVFILLLSSLFLPGVQAGQLDHWHWRSPTPFANTLHGIAFGAGKFVAVSDGVIHLSADGVSWDEGHRLIADALLGVTYANNQFVAVGNNGAIVTSPDGFTWTKRNSGATNALLGVIYGNGKYLACGKAGQIDFSADGITWSPGFFGANDITWAAAGNGVFMLPGGNLGTPSNNIVYVEVSTDGVSWNPANVFTTIVSWSAVNGVTFANGRFVALVLTAYGTKPFNAQAQTMFYSSTDGINWNQGALVAGFNSGNFTGTFTTMTYANGAAWILFGSSLVKTIDGFSFSLNSAPSANGFAYGNGNYVMVGNTGEVFTSADGTNWTSEYVANPNNIGPMVLGPNGYLAVSSGPIFNSTDGLTFKALPNSPVLGYTDIAYDGSNVVAVAGGGALYTSSDGINWTQRNSNSGGQTLGAVTRGAARWVAVGAGGTIITSPSGAAWTLRFSGTANNLHGVAYGNAVYVAVGDGGSILTSSDGATWDVQDSGTVAALSRVQYLNGQFYAVGAQGTILSSSDGVTWTSQNSGVSTGLVGVTYGNGMYVVAGSVQINEFVGFYGYTKALLLQSTNGINWQDISTNLACNVGLNSVAFLGGSFWVVGDGGSILQSDSSDGQPVLAGSMLPVNGGFRLSAVLNAPDSYTIQAKNSLNSGWQDALSVTNPVITHVWTDTNAAASPARFYRIKSTK